MKSVPIEHVFIVPTASLKPDAPFNPESWNNQTRMAV